MRSHSTGPVLTVVVAAVDDYSTVREALCAVEDQTALPEIELLVVLDKLERFGAPDDFAHRHPHARIIEVGRPMMLNEARAIGVARSSSEFVFFLEDHCLPARDCLAEIIARLREDCWAVVGPAFASGNSCSTWGRSANLLTYGEWMGYGMGEERRFVAGYSSAWRRSSLHGLHSHLEQELAIPSRLQQRLRHSGERLSFEARAVMFHWEASYHRHVRHILFRQGLCMGFIRQGACGFLAKLRASLLFPALLLFRSLRGARAWRRTRENSLRVLLAIPWLALVWCVGELAGYWTRDARRALRGVSEVERNRQPYIDAGREPIRRPWAPAEAAPVAGSRGRG